MAIRIVGICIAIEQESSPKTAELMQVTVIDNVWCDLMFQNMFPTIRSSMYHAKASTVLQFDSAKVHFKDLIQENIDRELYADDFNIKLEQHIAQLPDLNVSDSRFFNSLQRRSVSIKDQRIWQPSSRVWKTP